MAGAVTVTGQKDLDKILTHMRVTAARRAINLGTKKAAMQLRKDVKAAIPSRYKEARKNANWRQLKQNEAPGGGAKVGARVGKGAKNFKGREGRKGVGLGRGLSWLIKGTKDRKTRAGKPTGRFPSLVESVMRVAMANKTSTRLLLRKWTWEGIKNEVRKGKAF